MKIETFEVIFSLLYIGVDLWLSLDLFGEISRDQICFDHSPLEDNKKKNPNFANLDLKAFCL